MWVGVALLIQMIEWFILANTLAKTRALGVNEHFRQRCQYLHSVWIFLV